MLIMLLDMQQSFHHCRIGQYRTLTESLHSATSFPSLVSYSFIVQIPLPRIQNLRIETKSEKLLKVVDVDDIEISRAQCPLSDRFMHFSVLYILFQCVLFENEATAIDIYMRIALGAHRTAILLILVEFRYASHHSHTLKYTLYPHTCRCCCAEY